MQLSESPNFLSAVINELPFTNIDRGHDLLFSARLKIKNLPSKSLK